MKSHVVIYSRPNCHLCEEAKKEMIAADCDAQYTLQEVNIESNLELLERYKFDIPVIMIDGREAFRHRLTAREFKARILLGSSG